MRKKILNILLGKFLIDQINSNNLKLILFVFSMAFTLIFLSHSVDSKIYKINTSNIFHEVGDYEFLLEPNNLDSTGISKIFNEVIK